MMLDADAIMSVIAALAAGALYPNGTGQPSATGALTKVYPGWPVRAALDPDLAAGGVHVTVFPDASGKITTPHLREWRQIARTDNLITMTIVGNVVTFSGAPVPPQNIGLRVIDGAPAITVTYAVQAGDTVTSVAAGLAALIPGAASSLGVLTLPETALVDGSIGVWGTMAREVARVEQRVMVNVWAPSPDLRSATSRALMAKMAPLTRLMTTDGSAADITPVREVTLDEMEEARLYRRILFFDVDYPLSEFESAPQIVAINGSIEASQFDGNATVPTFATVGEPA